MSNAPKNPELASLIIAYSEPQPELIGDEQAALVAKRDHLEKITDIQVEENPWSIKVKGDGLDNVTLELRYSERRIGLRLPPGTTVIKREYYATLGGHPINKAWTDSFARKYAWIADEVIYRRRQLNKP